MAATKWTVRQIPSQTGKTALVTGANSGIGYQAALELARHGAHVLLACRNGAKGRAALERLKREAPGAAAELVEVDMASLASIRSFATAFAGRGIPLDLLINNAGVMALPKREVTVDGFERQFGTNHLGHFALTGLLVRQLLAAPAPRVVTVASLAHRNGKIDFDNLQSERGYKPLGAYGESKLANILLAKELDRRARAAHSKLISLAVHPGISMTNIMVNGPGTRNLQAIVLRILAPILIQPDAAGALPTLYAATSPDAKGGEYIGPDGFQEFKGSPVVVQPRANGLDEAVGKRLWRVSEELTGVVYPALGYPPIPPDDLNRTLTLANPDHEGKLPHIGLVGDTYTVTVDGDDTKGRFCVIDMHIPPGGGPGPHRHDFEETFVVLDGEIQATFRGKKSIVRAGETVNIPANAPHQFHNSSTDPARLICICSPAGQEKFFLEVGVPVATRTTAPPKLDDKEMATFLEKAKALTPKYHTELLKEA